MHNRPPAHGVRAADGKDASLHQRQEGTTLRNAVLPRAEIVAPSRARIQGGIPPHAARPFGRLHWVTIVAHDLRWPQTRPTLNYALGEQSIREKQNSGGENLKSGKKDFLRKKIMNHNYEILCFTDSNSSYWGKRFEGKYEIIPPEKIEDLSFDVIIVCSIYSDDIRNTLTNHCNKNAVQSFFQRSGRKRSNAGCFNILIK